MNTVIHSSTIHLTNISLENLVETTVPTGRPFILQKTARIKAQEVLQKLDGKTFGFFHIKMIVISGMGFFTDAYDLFSISLLTNILGRLYFQDNPYYLNSTVNPGKLPINYNVALSAVALCGALFGQVLFGFLADCLGRRSVYGLSLAIMIFTGFTQSMTFGTTSHAMVGTLCFWRFLLGVGVGGDYPLSATIMSEYSSTISRGAYIGSVFAMQGIGYLFAAVITAIVTACFQTAYPNGNFPIFVGPVDGSTGYNNGKWQTGTIDNIVNQAYYVNQLRLSNPPENDYTWRVVLGLSAIPAALTMYFRLHMAETPRFTLHVLKNSTAMTNDMSHMLEGEIDAFDTVSSCKEPEVNTQDDLSLSVFFWKYGYHLIGAALSWFFLDVGFYSQSLFQKDVFLQVGFIPPAIRMSALRESMVTAKAQALIALGSTIPGYWVTVFTVDILGRKNIQIGGFIAMTTFMAAMSGAYFHLLNPNNHGGAGLSKQQPLMRNGWIAMYAFTFFFANWGPNSTTFIVPAELFPTKFKATGHGICAAIGKAGAIIGAFGFLFAAQPHTLESTWSFPCTYDTDFYHDAAGNRLGCKLKTNCPTGTAVTPTTPAPIVPALCDWCNVKLLSGCAPYGLGVQGALGILAGINFCGLLTTFMIPETMGKSLEELNGEDLDLVGLPSENGGN